MKKFNGIGSFRQFANFLEGPLFHFLKFFSLQPNILCRVCKIHCVCNVKASNLGFTCTKLCFTEAKYYLPCFGKKKRGSVVDS